MRSVTSVTISSSLTFNSDSSLFRMHEKSITGIPEDLIQRELDVRIALACLAVLTLTGVNFDTQNMLITEFSITVAVLLSGI